MIRTRKQLKEVFRAIYPDQEPTLIDLMYLINAHSMPVTIRVALELIRDVELSLLAIKKSMEQ